MTSGRAETAQRAGVAPPHLGPPCRGEGRGVPELDRRVSARAREALRGRAVREPEDWALVPRDRFEEGQLGRRRRGLGCRPGGSKCPRLDVVVFAPRHERRPVVRPAQALNVRLVSASGRDNPRETGSQVTDGEVREGQSHATQGHRPHEDTLDAAADEDVAVLGVEQERLDCEAVSTGEPASAERAAGLSGV